MISYCGCQVSTTCTIYKAIGVYIVNECLTWSSSTASVQVLWFAKVAQQGIKKWSREFATVVI